MEESTQRRERLKAMRLEASQATNNDERSTSLSNPLLESTTNPESQSPQSFNYYTNPMAAYSGNKQSRQVSPQTSQNYSSTPQRSPSLQTHINHSPDPHMQQPPGQYAPRPTNYTNYSGPGRNSYSPHHPGGYYGPSPQTHFTSHVSGQGGGYPNQGRGQWFRNNMSSGPTRGRGRGNNNHVTAENRPDRFFNKSMVEDPWKFLEPVIWKSQKKQWLPHSLGAKKPRVSEQSSSSSQLSLAEILAASFKDVANDESNAG